MRHDIRQGVKQYMNDDIKPNYAALARQYNVDYQTAKRAFEEARDDSILGVHVQQRPSLLDDYRDVINAKLELHCSAMSIFLFIR